MPKFSPGEAKVAIAPITVTPAGLSCTAEIFLARKVPSVIKASDNPQYTDASNSYSSSGSWDKLKEYALPYSFRGSIRIKYALRAYDVGYTVYGRIYLNGSPIGTQRATSSTFVTYAEDFVGNWAAGDKIQIYAKGVSATQRVCISDFWVCYDVVEVVVGKVATSGLVPFASTGVSQNVRLSITMPSIEGTYPIYIDIYAEDTLIGAYQVIGDMVIAIPIVSGWSRYSLWQPWCNAAAYPDFYYIFKDGRITTVSGVMDTQQCIDVGIDMSDILGIPGADFSKAIGRSATVWLWPTRYIVITIVGMPDWEGYWPITEKEVRLGLGDSRTISYLRSIIPLETPYCLHFDQCSSSTADAMFNELEANGAADVTDVYYYPAAPSAYARLVVYNIDLLISIIRKHGWLVFDGGQI